MDELFAPVADGKSKPQGLGFSGPIADGAAWLGQPGCCAQPEGCGGTLVSGLVTAVSSTVLFSPGRSCHFRRCTNPTEAPLACSAKALLCRTLDNVYGLPGVNLAGGDEDHQVPVQQIKEGFLAKHWTHLKFSLCESQWDFPAACPRVVLLISN